MYSGNKSLNYLNKKSAYFIKKQIIYHEIGHLLMAYYYEFSCNKVSFEVNVEIRQLRVSSEINIESSAKADINLPINLLSLLNNIISRNGLNETFDYNMVSKEELVLLIRNYETILYAGYEAEIMLHKGVKYYLLENKINYILSSAQTASCEDDYNKISTINKYFGFTETSNIEFEVNSKSEIQMLYNKKNIQKIFSELYKLSKNQTILYKEEIENILQKFNFKSKKQLSSKI